jgi:hypothetical protein
VKLWIHAKLGLELLEHLQAQQGKPDVNLGAELSADSTCALSCAALPHYASLQKNYFPHALFGEIVSYADTDNPAANDHNLST